VATFLINSKYPSAKGNTNKQARSNLAEENSKLSNGLAKRKKLNIGSVKSATKRQLMRAGLKKRLKLYTANDVKMLTSIVAAARHGASMIPSLQIGKENYEQFKPSELISFLASDFPTLSAQANHTNLPIVWLSDFLC